MSSVFSILAQPLSQEDVKKDVSKFSKQQEKVRCQSTDLDNVLKLLKSF